MKTKKVYKYDVDYKKYGKSMQLYLKHEEAEKIRLRIESTGKSVQDFMESVAQRILEADIEAAKPPPAVETSIQFKLSPETHGKLLEKSKELNKPIAELYREMLLGKA